MNHVDLLGVDLKSDFLCDLFETYDVDVVYSYDRLHEGAADEYRASIPALGLELIFGQDQVLETVFATPVEVSGFQPLGELGQSVPLFDSLDRAQAFAANEKVPVSSGSASFLGEARDWVRFEYPTHRVHYEFRGGQLRLITLSRPTGRDAAGGGPAGHDAVLLASGSDAAHRSAAASDVRQGIADDFAALPLHDATLQALQVSWAASQVVADLVPLQLGAWSGQRIKLTWLHCSRLSVPHESPWGPSGSVHAHGRDGRRFWLEMQSGDVVDVWASDVRIERLPNVTPESTSRD